MLINIRLLINMLIKGGEKVKKDLRIIKTEESLRKALLTLLKTKTLETITISELCRLAQINRGTFYLHYRDVHDVFRHYFEVIVEDFRKAYEKPYLNTNFNINNMTPDMIDIFNHVKKYKAFYQIIFDGKSPMTYYYLVFDTIRKFMEESLSIDNNAVYLDVDFDYLISYHANAIIGIIIEWHKQNYTTPIEILNEQLIKLITNTRSYR